MARRAHVHRARRAPPSSSAAGAAVHVEAREEFRREQIEVDLAILTLAVDAARGRDAERGAIDRGLS